MAKAGETLSALLGEVFSFVKPGVSTKFLDEKARAFVEKNKIKSAFLGYKGFPSVLCTSVNDVLIHGVPDDVLLKDGDLLSIDCGISEGGYYADSAYSVLVGAPSEKTKAIQALCNATEESLDCAIASIKVGGYVEEIGDVVEGYLNPLGYGVVREYGGHGIGKNLHQEPYIPNFGGAPRQIKIREGMVFAIEPIVTMGSRKVFNRPGQWPVCTQDGSFGAHFEHTVAVVNGKGRKLTDFSKIKSKFATYGRK